MLHQHGLYSLASWHWNIQYHTTVHTCWCLGVSSLQYLGSFIIFVVSLSWLSCSSHSRHQFFVLVIRFYSVPTGSGCQLLPPQLFSRSNGESFNDVIWCFLMFWCLYAFVTSLDPCVPQPLFNPGLRGKQNAIASLPCRNLFNKTSNVTSYAL